MGRGSGDPHKIPSFLSFLFPFGTLIPTKGSQRMIYNTEEKERSHIPGVVFGVVVYAAFIVITAHAVVGGI